MKGKREKEGVSSLLCSSLDSVILLFQHSMQLYIAEQEILIAQTATSFYFLFLFLPGNEDFVLPVDVLLLGSFFPNGSLDGAILCVDITIIDDECFEKNHTFEFLIASTEENVAITPIQTVTIVIIDNEGILIF